MPNETPKEVEYFFEYDPNYRIIAANGMWGGLTPRGDLRLDFFVESMGIPDTIKNRVTQDGQLGAEIERTPQRRLVRRMQVGVLIDLTQAEAIADFIRARINEFKELRKKK